MTAKIKIPTGTGSYIIAGTDADKVDIVDSGNHFNANNVEDALQEVAARTENVDGKVGDLNNLQTTDKSNVISAINENKNKIDDNKTNIGTLSNLQTTSKTNIVSAVNEVKGKVDTTDNKVGNLASLATTVKTDIVSAINEIGGSPASTPVNLGYGLQVVNASRTAPLQNVKIKGGTLVNLLGRDGNCEVTSKWNTYQSSLALDTSNKVYGSNGIKITITTSTIGSAYQTVNFFKTGKYYVVIADLKNGNATTGSRISVSGYNTSAYVTSTTEFKLVYVKVNPTADIAANVNVDVEGSTGQYAYVDGVRVFEITQAEYNEIDTMTPEQIAAKYPYVDDVKGINTPYILKYGENLLPPFNEWTYRLGTGASSSIDSPYSTTLSGLTSGTDSYIEYNLKVFPNTTYTLSAQHNGYLTVWDVSNNNRLVQFTSNQSVTFTTSSNTSSINVAFDNASTLTGSMSLNKPMLNFGPTALPFKPRVDNLLAIPEKLHSNVGGTVYDSVVQGGQKFYKESRFKEVELNGSLDWKFAGDRTGYKVIYIQNFRTNNGMLDVDYQGVCAKFDGKILASEDYENGSDRYNFKYAALYVTIADADSGWGEDYTPSVDEIKAYFYGWRMYQEGQDAFSSTYTSGNKWWAYRRNGVANSAADMTGATSILPTYQAAGFTPYKLVYQLATPTYEEIQVEGGVTFHEGQNQVEVGNGIILREKAIPYFDGGSYYSLGDSRGNLLSRRVGSILAIYKNGLRENQAHRTVLPSAGQGWSLDYNDFITYGKYKGVLHKNDFDPKAMYEVTYFALDQYALTSNVTAISGEYASNLKTAVDSISQAQAGMLDKINALEATRARKVQGQWITPTLLNGWVNTDTNNCNSAGYFKDEFGVVYLKGLVNGGGLNVIFVLPSGYRPSKLTLLSTISNNGTSIVVTRVDIGSNGAVKLDTGGTTWLSLDGLSFLAEQ